MDVLHLDVYIDTPEGVAPISAQEFVKRRLMQSCERIQEASVVLALYDDKRNLLKTVVEGPLTDNLKRTIDEIS